MKQKFIDLKKRRQKDFKMTNISVSSWDTDYSRISNVQRSIMVLIYIIFLLNPLIVQLLEDGW